MIVWPAAIRIINQPDTDAEYEYEVARFFGISGLNDDETYEHVGYFESAEAAEAAASACSGIILRKSFINGKRLLTAERLAELKR